MRTSHSHGNRPGRLKHLSCAPTASLCPINSSADNAEMIAVRAMLGRPLAPEKTHKRKKISGRAGPAPAPRPFLVPGPPPTPRRPSASTSSLPNPSSASTTLAALAQDNCPRRLLAQRPALGRPRPGPARPGNRTSPGPALPARLRICSGPARGNK